MAEDWVQAETHERGKQAATWQSGFSKTPLVQGRVLRTGRREATEFAEYWDVVILAGTFADIDLNTDDMLGTGIPCYPYIADVASHVDSGVGEGDIVTVRTEGNVGPGMSTSYEVFNDTHDLRQVGTGGKVLSGAGAGACAACFLNAGPVWE